MSETQNHSKNCATRSFRALMAVVFLGSLNSNIFKLSVSFFALKTLSGQPQKETLYTAAIAGLFVLPFILCSPYAGLLADRFPKDKIIRYAKIGELVVILVGLYFFIQRDIDALLVVLFALGICGSIFSPCKYSILPEMLEDQHLSMGNGYVEFWTFIAIVTGTAAAGGLSSIAGDGVYPQIIAMFVIAVLGLISSFLIKNTGYQGTPISLWVNPLREVLSDLREICADSGMKTALLAIAYFWTFGAFFQQNTLLFAEQAAQLDEWHTTILLIVLAVGVGMGSLVAGRLSHGRVELSLIPFGIFGLALFTVLLSFGSGSFVLMLVFSALVGFSCGPYIVPLDAYYQKRADPQKRGRFVAVGNFLCFSGMLLSSVFILFNRYVLGLEPAAQFFLIGIISLLVFAVIKLRIPILAAKI